MRILLDEHLNIRLYRVFGDDFLYRVFGDDFDAETVAYRGWKGVTNGELLQRVAEEYDGFLTLDRGIPHQQRVEVLDLRVIVLEAESDDFNDLAPLIPLAEEAFRDMADGEVRHVQAPA